jgi:hypothetical protein
LPELGNFGTHKPLINLSVVTQQGIHLMELPAPALLAGVFLVGALVGYAIRAFISAKRRARYRNRRNDFL